jgi:hypothetical protein
VIYSLSLSADFFLPFQLANINITRECHCDICTGGIHLFAYVINFGSSSESNSLISRLPVV